MRYLRVLLPDIGISLVTIVLSTYVFFVAAFTAPGEKQTTQFGINAEGGSLTAYIEWWGDVFDGKLGGRYQSDEMLWGQIMHGVGESIVLVSVASGVSLAGALAASLFIIANRERWWAAAVERLGYFSSAIPVFVIALVIFKLLESNLSVITIGPGDNVWHNPMPYFVAGAVLSVGSGVLGELMKIFSGEIGRIMNEPFIQAARARSANIVLHVGKASVVPLFSAVVTRIPYLVGAGLIVEKVFGIHGLAELIENSASSGNFAKLMSVTLIIVLFVIGSRLLNKALVAIVDPRVR